MEEGIGSILFYENSKEDVKKGMEDHYSDMKNERYLNAEVSFDGTWISAGISRTLELRLL